MQNYIIAGNQIDTRGRVRTARRSDAQTGQSLAQRRTWFADPTSFNYQLEDDQGLHNNNSMFVSYNGATQTVDALIGAWLAYGGLLDPLVDGQIINGSITIPLIPDASWKTAPVVGNNVNQLMVLDFDNDFNSYVTGIDLPSYKETLLSVGTRVPNLAFPALAAYIAAVIAGTGNTFPQSNSIHDLDALRKAFLTVRKVKDQRIKTTVMG